MLDTPKQDESFFYIQNAKTPKQAEQMLEEQFWRQHYQSQSKRYDNDNHNDHERQKYIQEELNKFLR